MLVRIASTTTGRGQPAPSVLHAVLEAGKKPAEQRGRGAFLMAYGGEGEVSYPG